MSCAELQRNKLTDSALVCRAGVTFRRCLKVKAPVFACEASGLVMAVRASELLWDASARDSV